MFDQMVDLMFIEFAKIFIFVIRVIGGLLEALLSNRSAD